MSLSSPSPPSPSLPQPHHLQPKKLTINKRPNSTDAWFKIAESGMEAYNGGGASDTWAVDPLMVAGNAGYTYTIPSCLADGFYLVRHEIIAVFVASSYPGAQLYPGCHQLNVTGGSGSTVPTDGLVAFPGAYAGSDPGITWDSSSTTYPIPGPTVLTCAGDSAASSPSSSSVASSAAAASSTASSSATSATSAAASSTVAPVETAAASSSATTLSTAVASATSTAEASSAATAVAAAAATDVSSSSSTSTCSKKRGLRRNKRHAGRE